MDEKLIEPIIEDEAPTAAKKVFVSAQKVTIVSISAFLFLLFAGIVIFSSRYGTDAPSATPTPAPDGLFQVGEQGQFSAKSQQQVQGAQTQAKQPQVPPMPTKPPATPTPSPSATPTPSPTPSPSPSASPADSEGPKVSGIASENVENNKATIKFSVSEEADAKVEYGTDTSYGKNKEESSKKTSHSIELTDLEANKTYHYRIISKDAAGNSTTSGDNEFTTKP